MTDEVYDIKVPKIIENNTGESMPPTIRGRPEYGLFKEMGAKFRFVGDPEAWTRQLQFAYGKDLPKESEDPIGRYIYNGKYLPFEEIDSVDGQSTNCSIRVISSNRTIVFANPIDFKSLVIMTKLNPELLYFLFYDGNNTSKPLFGMNLNRNIKKKHDGALDTGDVGFSSSNSSWYLDEYFLLGGQILSHCTIDAGIAVPMISEFRKKGKSYAIPLVDLFMYEVVKGTNEYPTLDNINYRVNTRSKTSVAPGKRFSINQQDFLSLFAARGISVALRCA